MAAALVLFPCVAAAGTPPTAVAAFSFARGTIFGPAEWTSDEGVGLYWSGGEGAFWWTLSARSMAVNWTNATDLEYGRPTDLSEPHGQFQWGDPRMGQENFTDATASSNSRSAASTAMLIRTKGAMVGLSGNLSHVVIGPAPPGPWAVGRRQGIDGVSPVGDVATATFEVPAEVIQAAVSDQLSVRGDFSFFVYEAAVTVDDGDGKSTFEAGTWTKGLVPPPPGQPSPVRERYYQLLRLDVQAGELQFKNVGRGVVVAAQRLACLGELEAHFDRAQGNIQVQGRNVSLLEDNFTFAGQGRLETWNSTADGEGLTARLTANPRDFGLAGAREPTVPLPVPKRPADLPASDPGVPLGGILLVGALALAAPFVVLRVRSRGTLDEAEWALLRGEPRRAYAIARRILRRRPKDADVLFIAASALFGLGYYEELVSRLRPFVDALAVENRSGLAFVLATSYTKLGRPAEAEPWVLEAAKDPLLERRLRQDVDAPAGYA